MRWDEKRWPGSGAFVTVPTFNCSKNFYLISYEKVIKNINTIFMVHGISMNSIPFNVFIRRHAHSFCISNDYDSLQVFQSFKVIHQWTSIFDSIFTGIKLLYLIPFTRDTLFVHICYLKAFNSRNKSNIHFFRIISKIKTIIIRKLNEFDFPNYW